MAAPKKQDPVIAKERAEAWTGDAVLALYVREWILREFGAMDGEMFVRFTSNDFLSCAGNPTSVEAQIGRVYATDGLQAGFDWIEKELHPKFLVAEKEYQRRQLTQVPRRLRKYGKK
ncbi:MAG: ribonuclease III domain-containing protein [Rubritalea sp.]|mgnify:CR=1 FL=1|uniref:ribonuclease III domain-containing protein n=1 Tax=Rubritalea sp. TaxID=2109375 RepID=UPI00324240BB